MLEQCGTWKKQCVFWITKLRFRHTVHFRFSVSCTSSLQRIFDSSSFIDKIAPNIRQQRCRQGYSSDGFLESFRSMMFLFTSFGRYWSYWVPLKHSHNGLRWQGRKKVADIASVSTTKWEVSQVCLTFLYTD